MSINALKRLITAAINTGQYGTDAIANGTPKAIQTFGDIDITPIEGDQIDRELDDGKLGNKPVLMVGTHVKASSNVELTGSGVAVDAPPAFDIILQAAGFVGTAEVDRYVYTRAPENTEKDATFYVYKDKILHKVRGARLSLTTKLNVGEIPSLAFDLTGLYGSIESTTLPTPDLSDFIKPVKVGATHTTFKIGTSAAALTEMRLLEFELTENNEITFDENTVEEKVYLTNFKPEGKFRVEAPTLGEFNPFEIALSEQLMHLEITHGTEEANVAGLVLPKIQFGRPTYSPKDGRQTYEVPFRVIGSDYEYFFK